MTRFGEINAALRRKNLGQYGLLAGCCFFSVLLITAYAAVMYSPTVLTILPEGGDSRKQVMMVFVLAVLGCGVFTTYASGLFFRYKSREMGIFMALGATKRRLRQLLTAELALLALAACGLGALLGTPLAWLLWQGFRSFVVDSADMVMAFSYQPYLFALAFSAFIFAMLFIMMVRFLRRANILDVIHESHKSEPIRAVPRYYGWLGILLVAIGCFLGYLMPSVFILGLKWYPPEGLTSIFYLPALVGLYMLLLHTVVNGWRRGKGRYKNLISTSLMQFQGRQTVRNMIVITLLVAGAYFASFYTPLLATSAGYGFDTRKADNVFHYRADQPLPDEAEIRALAEEMQVDITRFAAAPSAILGLDGTEEVETQGSFGNTYEHVYQELLQGDSYISASSYTALTGEALSLAPGSITTVFTDEGLSDYRTTADISIVTNPITGQTLRVSPTPQNLSNTLLLGYHVLNDADFEQITKGLPIEWREKVVLFDVADEEASYPFAKELFNRIVDATSPELALHGSWDPVEKLRAEAAGETYFQDPENLEEHGLENIDYANRDGSNFRLGWKYMPQFRILDKTEFVKSMAVFLMLFIFVAIICFAAVAVILFTRSVTIALTNRQIYQDLGHLGASPKYLRRTVKAQLSKIYFAPILIGTLLICLFYSIILVFNDMRFSPAEQASSINCLLVVAGVSLALYGLYRFALYRVCRMLHLGR